eukprot:449562-Pleurochrysis_carterae.AAC.1
MVRPLRSRPTTQRGLRSPHSPTCREWTAAARPPRVRRGHMHATPTPRTTRVTRTAHGNGARHCHLWCLSLHCTRLCAVCVPLPPARTAPLSTRTALASGGKPPANATGGSDALN